MKALLFAGLLFSSFGLTADWPYFRGPDHTGTVSKDLIQGKTFGLETAWKKELGSGYACISLVGDLAVTMFSDDKNNLLAAFDAHTGAEKWRYVFGPVYKGHSGSQDGPTGTPTIHGDTVYAIDTYGQFVAVNLADGKKLWGHTLGEDIKARVPHYGFNTVPMVVDNKVIVMTGHKEGRTFTAFDPKTGKELWHSGDDTATYQSPIFQEVNGKQRIMAITDNYLMELDPADGKIFWKAKHDILDNETYALPVLAGKDRVVIQDRHQVAAFRLKRTGDTATMTELWRGPILMRTYALPVYHQDHLYGFKSGFLTCVDAETGEIKWRSRPPRGDNLTLLGDSLIIISNKGNLVAVEATPEEYRETARIELFDRGSYSAASFAHGALFVRNLKEMARVNLIDKKTLASLEKPKVELKGEFGNWVRKVQKAENKTAMVDAFMKKQKSFPIIEGDSLVHYVFRGDQKDLGVTRGFDDEKPMHRIEGTDLFFHSEEVESDSHWEYHFSSFGDRVDDPLNPHQVGASGRMRSELRMPGWEAPDYLGEPKGPRGKIDTFEFESKIRGDKREVKVYLPPGYADSEARYPLMIVNNGLPVLDVAKMDVALDNLIGKKVAPVIVAFISGNRNEMMGEDQMSYVEFLTTELLPHLDKTYRTKAEPAARGLMGAGQSSVVSLVAAMQKPHHFGKLAQQSYVMLEPAREQHLGLVKDGEVDKVSVFVDISTNDYKFPGIDAEASSRELVKLLKEKGYEVTTTETASGPGYASWRARYGKIMAWFSPLK
ncbi:MAG: PQQ-binding-like beta-propeller repeat protein [Acidobacteriota bacterium]|nr:PQQ-binding-like beta-propeller repeat protein [Acidobacteriota bacterium]